MAKERNCNTRWYLFFCFEHFGTRSDPFRSFFSTSSAPLTCPDVPDTCASSLGDVSLELAHGLFLLRNSCPYTIYPTFSSPLTEHPIYPSTNSSLHRTDIWICPHSSPTPISPRRNPVPIIDASSCFTFLVLIHFALLPVLRSAGLHLVPHMFSSLDSAVAPHLLHSTGTSF